MSELNVTKIENEADSSAVEINRKASHGSIVDLQKDGTTLGFITTRAGDVIQISSAGTNSGLDFAGGINPVYSGSLSDNQVDIGYSAYRFKDLYLSGGVYLGGTGSANYLDDYEEGTWTPVGYTGNSSGFNPTVTAFWGGDPTYVKVGGLVHVQGGLYFGNSSGSVAVGDLVVIEASSLPFTPISQPSSSGSFYAYNANYAHVSCHMQTDGRVYLYVHTVVGSPLRTGGAIALGISYKTNS